MELNEPKTKMRIVDVALEKIGTKEKIVRTSMDLFSKKGFTETGVREIAANVGINESSLYNHFDSKGAILDFLLEYYKQNTNALHAPDEAFSRLTKDATADDVMEYLILYYPLDEEIYNLKTLQVLLQEQFRNESVREYIANDLILWQEKYASSLIQHLVDAGALDKDTDVDFWAKLHTSNTYMFSVRMVLGIGESAPHFKGKGNEEMLRTLYDTIFKLHGTKNRR